MECQTSPYEVFFDGLAAHNVSIKSPPAWEQAPSTLTILEALLRATMLTFPDLPMLIVPPAFNLLLAALVWNSMMRVAAVVCCIMLTLPYVAPFASVYFHAGFALTLFIGTWKFYDLAGGTNVPAVRESLFNLGVHMACPVEYAAVGCDRAKELPRVLRSFAFVGVGSFALETLSSLHAAGAMPAAPAALELAASLYADTWRVLFLLQLPFAASQLFLVLAGFTPLECFRHPLLLSTSPADFWGRRWNLLIHGLFKRTIFKPLRARGLPAQAAAASAFLVSGLFHEYAFLAPPAARALGGRMLGFFLLQFPLVTAEKLLAPHVPAPLARALGAAPLLCTALTTAAILPLAPLFMAPLHASGLLRELQSFVPVGYVATCAW